MEYSQHKRYDRDVFDACPDCGERGAPWWEGPNRRPHSANRGILVFNCGTRWRCGEGTCVTGPGCKATQLFCYHCGCTAVKDRNYPATWEPCYFAS